MHNEYHGDQDGVLPAACPSGLHDVCTLISLTYVVSSDGGKTYVKPPNPTHLVATSPYQYDPDAMRALWEPSNIVQNPNDGYYYMLVQRDEHVLSDSNALQGMCVMRTKTLDNPASWRAWDGQGFNMDFINPYLEPDADPSKHTCQLVSPEVGALASSLSYSSYYKQFIAVGVAGQPMPGFYFSLSEDLVHWTPRQFIMFAPQGFTSGGQTPFYAYPTLIDPDSLSDNFDIVGQSPYLYYSRFNSLSPTLDIDLLRVQIKFSKEAGQTSDSATSNAPLEPVTIQISQKETMVPVNTPIELTIGWADSSSALVSVFLSNTTFEVLVDGVPLENVMDYWGTINMKSPTSYVSRWVYPIGILKQGQHHIEYRMNADQPFTDGTGYQYSGTFLSGTIKITVGP